MKWANSFDDLYRQIRLRKGAFLIVFACIITVTYSFLYAIDFIPEPETPADDVAEEDTSLIQDEAESIDYDPHIIQTDIAVSELPKKIIFDSLNKEVSVSNPTSRVVADLDAALLSGAVRHPDSAVFSEDGNIFILAHSSYLPNVFNKNFQAFNGLQDLVWGDKIRLQSDDMEYVYRVQEVYKARASDVFVPNTPGEARLTLATCNSFGSKDDRFIVEALLIETKAL